VRPIDLQIAVGTCRSKQAGADGAGVEGARGSGCALRCNWVRSAPFGPEKAAGGNRLALFLRHLRWTPDPTGILFGRRRTSVPLAAARHPRCASRGDRIGVEPLTYPSIMAHRGAARACSWCRIAIDNEGIDHRGPDQGASRQARLRRSTSSLRSTTPLGISMTPFAAAKLLLRTLPEVGAGLHRGCGCFAFLSDAPPLVTYAPDRVIFIDSMHKRIAPGIGLGLVAAPQQLKDRIATRHARR